VRTASQEGEFSGRLCRVLALGWGEVGLRRLWRRDLDRRPVECRPLRRDILAALAAPISRVPYKHL
jgi:hypothetical protein